MKILSQIIVLFFMYVVAATEYGHAQNKNTITSDLFFSKKSGPLGRQLAVGADATSFAYQEGSLMKINGTLLGVQLEYAKKFNSYDNPWAIRTSFHLRQGQTTYQGGLQNSVGQSTTAYQFSENKITIYQWEGYLGRFFYINALAGTITPSIGLSYYFLFDSDDPDPKDYSREQRYITTPLRIDYRHQFEESFPSEIIFYFSYHPQSTFRGDNLTAGSIKYEQKKGSGKMAGIIYQFYQYQLKLEYESWNVEASSKAASSSTSGGSSLVAQQSYSYEPENETRMLTLNVSYLF